MLFAIFACHARLGFGLCCCVGREPTVEVVDGSCATI